MELDVPFGVYELGEKSAGFIRFHKNNGKHREPREEKQSEVSTNSIGLKLCAEGMPGFTWQRQSLGGSLFLL